MLFIRPRVVSLCVRIRVVDLICRARMISSLYNAHRHSLFHSRPVYSHTIVNCQIFGRVKHSKCNIRLEDKGFVHVFDL